MHVVEDGDHGGVYSIGAVPAPAPLTVTGPTLTLRYAELEDAPRLLELGADAGVTRFFSWGPYERVEEPQAYIASLAGKRERGEMLEFLIDHHEHGPIGVTGLSELSVRDRRATVGSWFGRDYWGTRRQPRVQGAGGGAGFETLGLERLTAWANTRNGRSQRALERVGFRREGVLAGWHRHGDGIARRRGVRDAARGLGDLAAARDPGRRWRAPAGAVRWARRSVPGTRSVVQTGASGYDPLVRKRTGGGRAGEGASAGAGPEDIGDRTQGRGPCFLALGRGIVPRARSRASPGWPWLRAPAAKAADIPDLGAAVAAGRLGTRRIERSRPGSARAPRARSARRSAA